MVGVILVVIVLLERFSLRVSAAVGQVIQEINQHIANTFGILYMHD